MSLQAKQFMFTKTISNNVYVFKKTVQVVLQVGDIEKIIVKNSFKMKLHYIKLMNFWKKNYDDLNFIMNSRFMKQNSKFKIFKVMKFTFETIFSQLLLRITFNDKF